MALVGYSDSEESDVDNIPVQTKTTNDINSKITKPTFQKVVDPSDSHKIRVNLPPIQKSEQIDERGDEEPPAKKAKNTAGALGGFNSILPAPKRAGKATGSLTNGSLRKRGLGSGVNLKTGAAPGFSRDLLVDQGTDAESDDKITEVGEENSNFKPDELGIPNDTVKTSRSVIGTEALKEEPKKKGTPMMFKPLSVARKPQKKKPSIATTSVVQPPLNGDLKISTKIRPQTSLFSIGNADEASITSTAEVGEYQPLIYENPYADPKEPDAEPETPAGFEPEVIDSLEHVSSHHATRNSGPGDYDLDSIAADLNLSASARRQLLGRQRNKKHDPSAINIVSFNTDQEYAANELLRQAGEQAQHNPVKAVAAGKHSLKQLINAASNQKDALEEHFASGRRNKKEAGSKYGW